MIYYYTADGESICKECVDTRVKEDTTYYQDNVDSLREDYGFIITEGRFTCDSCDDEFEDGECDVCHKVNPINLTTTRSDLINYTVCVDCVGKDE